MRTDPDFAERVRAWEHGVNRRFVDLHRPNGVDDVSMSFSGKRARFWPSASAAATSPRRRARSSDREGFGAVATLVVGKKNLVRELPCGEGLAAQNSATLLVCIGAADTVDKIEVRWPKGRKTVVESVPAGSLVTLWEEPTQSPEGKGSLVEPYASPTIKAAPVTAAPAQSFLPAGLPTGGADNPALRSYTSMATWCPSCKKELPQIEALKTALGASVALHGLPVDANDDAETLRQYVAANSPAYELLSALPESEIGAAKRLIVEALGTEALPATLVTELYGRVLGIESGVPTVSELKRLLEKVR